MYSKKGAQILSDKQRSKFKEQEEERQKQAAEARQKRSNEDADINEKFKTANDFFAPLEKEYSSLKPIDLKGLAIRALDNSDIFKAYNEKDKIFGNENLGIGTKDFEKQIENLQKNYNDLASADNGPDRTSTYGQLSFLDPRLKDKLFYMTPLMTQGPNHNLNEQSIESAPNGVKSGLNHFEPNAYGHAFTSSDFRDNLKENIKNNPASHAIDINSDRNFLDRINRNVLLANQYKSSGKYGYTKTTGIMDFTKHPLSFPYKELYFTNRDYPGILSNPIGGIPRLKTHFIVNNPPCDMTNPHSKIGCGLSLIDKYDPNATYMYHPFPKTPVVSIFGNNIPYNKLNPEQQKLFENPDFMSLLSKIGYGKNNISGFDKTNTGVGSNLSSKQQFVNEDFSGDSMSNEEKAQSIKKNDLMDSPLMDVENEERKESLASGGYIRCRASGRVKPSARVKTADKLLQELARILKKYSK